MNHPIDKIRIAINCADADLQGMLQRVGIADPSEEDCECAESTRTDLAKALVLLNTQVIDINGVVKALQGIADMADSESSEEHSDPIGDALEGLNHYLTYLKSKVG